MPRAIWQFRLVRREFNGGNLDNDLHARLCKLLCEAFPWSWRIIDIFKRRLGDDWVALYFLPVFVYLRVEPFWWVPILVIPITVVGKLLM